MNFLELINKCLLELNYKQVSSFAELVKNDHKKIKTVLNIVNQEICNTENWNFLLRKTTLTVPANASEVTNTVQGRIMYMFIDGKNYKYVETSCLNGNNIRKSVTKICKIIIFILITIFNYFI